MKTVVITGATSGIGNLLVQEFAKQDCKIFAGYRNIKLKRELTEISDKVIPFYIDMSKNWSISDAVKFISEKTEKIDTIINAAGAVYAGPMECLSVDKIKEQFEVNTFSHLELTQGLFEKLSASRHGRIINISSMASFGVFPFVAPYCASKRALDILFNSMQVECGGKCGLQSKQDTPVPCMGDIKVISIKPGVIRTPLWYKSIELNKDVLGEDIKYEKEMDFLIRNAKENAHSGLNPQKVVDLIVKVESLEKPKSSYTVGFDAKCAEILSHLPQDWINWIVRKNLERRCKY